MAIRMIGLLALACSNGTATAATFVAFMERLSAAPLECRRAMAEQYLATTRTTPLVHASGTVHFVWFASAGSVAIEGDLQDAWLASDELARIECGESDPFYVYYDVPLDAVLEYRFIVDRERKLDSRNTRVVQRAREDSRRFADQNGACARLSLSQSDLRDLHLHGSDCNWTQSQARWRASFLRDADGQ